MLRNIAVTLILALLAGWLIRHSWRERTVAYEAYSYRPEEASRLEAFPEARFDYGKAALLRGDEAEAARFFADAAAANPFHMEAWLRLAQADLALGRAERAREILRYTDRLGAGFASWRWRKALLALELGEDEVFRRKVNSLIRRNTHVSDALQLVDVRAATDPRAAIEQLEGENLEAYLLWLMRWGRAGDSRIVWEALAEKGLVNRDLALRYADFMVRKGRIRDARPVWARLTGEEGLTNPGFEAPVAQQAFGWRFRDGHNETWRIRRVEAAGKGGGHALEISFFGKENLNFHALDQIVPVGGTGPYVLQYWWKSRGLTTDQGPYLEVSGYKCRGLRERAEMMLGTNEWRRAEIRFVPPEDCEAVVVRLRRDKSWKFDCRIEGTLWLDDFELEAVGKRK